MGDLEEFYGPEGFDADAVEPQEDFEPIPPGWYFAVIEKCEPRRTKAGTGTYLNCQYSILGPQAGGDQFNNRKVFGTVTLSNPNQMATDIGARQMSALCRAVGVMHPRDTADLLDRPFLLRVKIEQSQDYEPKNVPSAWKSIQEAKQEAKQPAMPATPPPAPAAKTLVKPWQRKTTEEPTPRTGYNPREKTPF